MIQNVIKFASFFKTQISADAKKSKIVAEDRGSISKITYHVTVSAFKRGLVIYLRVDNFQQILEITENVKVPLEIPGPIGMLGCVVSLDNLNSTENDMTCDFMVDLSLGILGNTNLISQHISYVNEPDSLDVTKTISDINDIQFLILIGLIKADSKINDLEKTQFEEFMKSAGLNSERQSYFLNVLSSNDSFEIDYTLIQNTCIATGLLNVLVSICKSDNEVNQKEFEYIMNVCEKLQLNHNHVIEELTANYFAAKYFLKSLAAESGDVLVFSTQNNKKVQFYKNNRIFFFDSNNTTIAKGSYQLGGQKIILDDGKIIESPDVNKNLKDLLSN